MKTKYKIIIPLLLGLACAFGIFLGAKLDFSSQKLFASNPKKEKLSRLIDYIDYEYVDDINTDSIVDVTVNRILENLDPHSVYIPKKEYSNVTETMQGGFVGIGVSFNQVHDTVVVIQALEGGPGAKIGLRGGDRILYANGKKLFNKNLSTDSIIQQLKGEKNTQVKLKVLRKGKDKLLSFNVLRGEVPLKSVDAAYMLTPDLGYIKINRFSETTYEEFRKGIDKLKKEGATQIALDLRNNPGGYLAEAINVADEFLKDDKLILFTKNKRGAVEKTFAKRKGKFEEGKVFVLINGNSASASEVVTGALQDNDVGTIVGRRSYGKGLVQREMDLGDGSAVRLTIARYYTPTGRSIQKPYNNGNEEYFKDYQHRLEDGELKSADSIPIADSLKYTTPGGKVVYGGGGIIPDVFVPKDTKPERENLDLMLNGGFISRFAFNLLDEKRLYYNAFSEKEFENTVKIEDAEVKQFVKFSRDQGLNLKIEEYKPLLKKYIKASMAEQLFGSNAFQRLLNEDDRIINKTIQLSKQK